MAAIFHKPDLNGKPRCGAGEALPSARFVQKISSVDYIDKGAIRTWRHKHCFDLTGLVSTTERRT
jgi:hypothetical protein